MGINWAGLGSWLKKVPADKWVDVGMTVAPAIGGYIAGKGRDQNAAQVNTGNAIGSQVDWYGNTIPEFFRDEQAAMNAAMANYDPVKTYSNLSTMMVKGDILGDPDAQLARTKAMQPGWMQGRSGNAGFIPKVSPQTLARYQAPALMNLQGDLEQNLIGQSQGAFQPSNMTSAWGSGDQTAALQQALAKQRTAVSGSWQRKRDDYINQMNKGYGRATQWASGKVNT